MKTLIVISLLALCASSPLRINLDINDEASRQFIIQNFEKIGDSPEIRDQLDIVFFGHTNKKNLKTILGKNKQNLYMNALLNVFSKQLEYKNFFKYAVCVAKGMNLPESDVFDNIVDCDTAFESVSQRINYEISQNKQQIWTNAADKTYSGIEKFSLPFFSRSYYDLPEEVLHEVNGLLRNDFFGNFVGLANDEKRKELLKDLADTADSWSNRRAHNSLYNNVLDELVGNVPKSEHERKFKDILDELKWTADSKEHEQKYSSVLDELKWTADRKEHEQKYSSVLDELKWTADRKEHEEKYSSVLDELEELAQAKLFEEVKQKLINELKQLFALKEEKESNKAFIESLQKDVSKVKDEIENLELSIKLEVTSLEKLRIEAMNGEIGTEQEELLKEISVRKIESISKMERKLVMLNQHYIKLINIEEKEVEKVEEKNEVIIKKQNLIEKLKKKLILFEENIKKKSEEINQFFKGLLRKH